MAKTTKLQEIPIKDLTPYDRNAKLHPPEQVEKIAESIQQFGFLSPCLIDKDGNIIAGHGRVLAAKELGLESVPCVYVEGLTDEQRRAYILADNRLTELGGWDMAIVSEELDQLKAGGFEIDVTGFNVDDIIITEDEDVDIAPDLSEDEDEPPRTNRGEVWALGEHRLMCGDSTDLDDVSILMGG